MLMLILHLQSKDKCVISYLNLDLIMSLSLSVDDKAKVPVDLTAVTKQAPLIMYVRYETRLPGHNFVKAIKHNLTLHVYQAPFFKSRSRNNLLWSNKLKARLWHLETHGRGFDLLLELKEFNKVVKHENAVKSINMFFVMEFQMKTQDF